MSNLTKRYLKFIKKQETIGEKFYDKKKQLKNFYLPLCLKLFKIYKTKNRPILIGLSGSQGSGKSTISQIIKIILNTNFNLNVISFSIDDFYKTLFERKKLSKSIHPLFMTRGVPGTHDSKMLYNTIKILLNKNFHSIKIPKFDKSIDDRSKSKFWQKIKKKPDIIIFEGWCVGAKPQTFKELKKPMNILEKDEDTKLTWRKKVNNELKTNYKKIFNLLDKKIYLKVPNFRFVLKWRLLQEKKLKFKFKKKVMTSNEITRFIMFYERLTKNMIKDLKKNDTVIMIDKNHKIKSIKF
ncbi:MAG: uridine kinase [Candidatus Pelagibacter sp.]|nr:uridine kinase [Candidatus Pelagibacter sp.]